jgi:hypothetical protein
MHIPPGSTSPTLTNVPSTLLCPLPTPTPPHSPPTLTTLHAPQNSQTTSISYPRTGSFPKPVTYRSNPFYIRSLLTLSLLTPATTSDHATDPPT